MKEMMKTTETTETTNTPFSSSQFLCIKILFFFVILYYLYNLISINISINGAVDQDFDDRPPPIHNTSYQSKNISIIRTNVDTDDTLTVIDDGTINNTSDPLKETSTITTNAPFDPQESWTSSVERIGDTVVKKINNRKRNITFDVVGREVCALKLLQQFTWCPRLLGSTKRSITTSYVGETVNKENLPLDYAAQFRQILANMASVGVKHNDLIAVAQMGNAEPKKPKIEIMVLDGRLSLVDFTWASINDKIPCGVGVAPFLFIPGWKPVNDTRAMARLDLLA